MAGGPPTGGPPLVPPPDLNEEDSSKGFSMFPGTFEEMHRACKDIFPQLFEGIKIVANNGLSQNFQVSHNLTLASASPSGYRYGASYVGSKQISPTESFPLLLGEMDTNGSFTAQMIHQLTKSIRAKCIIQTDKTNWDVIQMDAAYHGQDFSATLMTANPDLVTGNGVYVLQYLQSFTPNLAFGSEFMIRRSVAMGQQGFLSLAAQLRYDKWRLAATVGTQSVHASYVYKHSKTLQLCTELESSTHMQQNTLSLGYQLDVPQANVIFRGQISSNWTVASILEKRLVPYPFTLQLCAIMNHAAQATRLGVGLSVG